MNKRTATVLAGVACAGLLGTGIAVADVIVPGAGNEPVNICYSQSASKVPNMFVQFRDENFGDCGAGYKHAVINQPQDSEIESDGPYPSATQLQDGANSTAKWAGDEGQELHKSWVKCPDGKVAVGGGFSRADEGTEAFKGLQIVTSSPAQVEGNKLSYSPIAGDTDGSFKPNAWLVEGFNKNASGELIVRPHVVCGKG